MGRPRKNPIIAGDSASAVLVEEKGKGKPAEDTPTKGRKKRVATDKSLEGGQKKRAKIDDDTPNQLPKAEDVVAKVAAKSTRTRSTIVAPKWKVVIDSTREPKPTTEKPTSIIKTLSPRIWTGSRDELLALLPELAGTKCFNGVSWYKFPTPMVVLDDTNRSFEIQRQDAQPLCLDLVTTRSFVCPIPTTPAQSTQSPVPSTQAANPDATHRRPFNAKAPVIRKAPRYRAPKSLGGINITAKVEYVPATALILTEPSVTNTNRLSTTSAPPMAGPANTPQSILSAAPDAINATTLRLTSPVGLPASINEAPSRVPDRPLLPLTRIQVSKLPELIDNAQRVASMYATSRAVTTSTASWDGPSHPPNVLPCRLSVLSTGSISQASSSKVTLDDINPPGAHSVPVADHVPETLSMETDYAPLHSDSGPSASFGLPSRQPDVSTKATTVHMPLAPITMDEASIEVTSASEGTIRTDTHQRGAPLMDETMKRINLASPGTVPSAAVPTTDLKQTSVPVMMGETAAEMNLATAEDILPLQRAEPETAANTKFHDTTTLSGFIPPQLPDEIAALIDAYISGRPLSVMVSRDRLKDNWGVEVKKEFGHVMLGFFRILGVQEMRVKDDNVKVSKLANGLCAGQVQWRFHLEWAPGGEEIILPDHPKDSLDWPWWNEKAKDPPPSVASETAAAPEAETRDIPSQKAAQVDEPENRHPTTSKYRQLRISNHEYKFRHCPLSEAYDSVVPEQVLVPFGRQHSDRVFPRGWLCTKCGRLNFQQALRHRKCPSSLCKDEPAPTDPYHYDLYWIRDPQERLPLNYPRNSHPPGTKVSQTKWQDGTQTFAYNINENSDIFIKHIFLGNVGELQKPISNIMDQVQLTVPLLRPMVDNNPYFFYTAKAPKGNVASTKKPWDGVPDCINDAKKQVVGRASWFAGVPEKHIYVKHVKVVAWITEGSKRGNEVIRAKNKCAMLLAMGCTTMLTVTPQSLEKTGAVVSSGNSDPQENSREDAESGWVAVGGKVDDDERSGSAEDQATPSAAATASAVPKKGRGAPRKKDRPSFTLSLYHGDMVIFYGDDFEYSFKRDGTSFMLFASHDEIV